MDKLKKYLLYWYLLENVAVQTSILGRLTVIFFYSFLGLGFLFIIKKEITKGTIIKTFKPFYLLSAIYMMYEFTLGSATINIQTLTYLVAKITTFAIIIVCVNYDYKFYEKKILHGLTIMMICVILYGIITGDADGDGSDRLMLGFTNANTTSAMGAFALGVILFDSSRWNLKKIFFSVISLYAILAGGSRAGVLVIVIILFMRYGLNWKLVSTVSLLIITSVFILPAIGLETAGVERMVDTYTGKEGTNRDLEQEACLIMIEEKPYTGWGFEAKNQGIAALISRLPAHNGYLDTLKYMGIPMGGLWILTYILSVVYIVLKYRQYNIKTDIYLAMLIALTVNAWFESLLVGVHEFATNAIFLCLAMTYKRFSLVKNNLYYE